jgi:hypothetical protein
MLLPAFGFIIGCVFFGVVGAIVLRLRKRERFRLMDLALFVAGALPTSLVAGWLYRVLVADSNGLLHSAAAVVAFFCVLFVSGAAGGLTAVWLFNRFRVA